MSDIGTEYVDELYHHGILGMRHGVRNGPPYPLAAGDHSEGEKKAGWRKSLSSAKQTASRGRAYISRRKEKKAQKKAAKIQQKAVGKNYIKQMSDDDLKRATNRMRLEREYLNELSQLQARNKTSKDRMKETLRKTGTIALQTIGKTAANEVQKKIQDKIDPQGAMYRKLKKEYDRTKLASDLYGTKLNREKNKYNYERWQNGDDHVRSEMAKQGGGGNGSKNKKKKH